MLRELSKDDWLSILKIPEGPTPSLPQSAVISHEHLARFPAEIPRVRRVNQLPGRALHADGVEELRKLERRGWSLRVRRRHGRKHRRQNLGVEVVQNNRPTRTTRQKGKPNPPLQSNQLKPTHAQRQV